MPATRLSRSRFMQDSRCAFSSPTAAGLMLLLTRPGAGDDSAFVALRFSLTQHSSDMIEPASIGQAASLGTAALQRMRRGTRLRVETKASAETRRSATGEEHTITLDVRLFNIGIPVTVRRVALVRKPSILSRLLGSHSVAADAPETGFSLHPDGTRSWRNLPAHIPSGDFHMFKFYVRDVWPPDQLAKHRLAVWYGASRRPLLVSIEPPLRILRLKQSLTGAFLPEDA